MVDSNLKNVKGLTRVILLRKTNVFSQKGSILDISQKIYISIINTYKLIKQTKRLPNENNNSFKHHYRIASFLASPNLLLKLPY